MAQVRLNLGQPEAAQDDIREAARLEGSPAPELRRGARAGAGAKSPGTTRRALEAFGQALARATDPDRPYANHELGGGVARPRPPP
ncbi:hypothetical protein [Deinococcus radiodurans]|uniref:hypothetical protein n=1 Tax=Deinococcus radiodurans TaxID=1299 RepID=UPI000ACDB270|nr:hypothetical protein [Deinococcus radiodurans]